MQKEKGMAEDEMARKHHQLNGHEFEQTPRDSEGQGSLACSSPWSGKESAAEQQQQRELEVCFLSFMSNNNNKENWKSAFFPSCLSLFY